MNFRTYGRARKNLIRAGVAVAPFVVAWHACPLSDENPLAVPPEHVEVHVHHPIESNRIEFFTSASSTSANLSVNIAERLRPGDQLLRVLPD